ncbi:MAG: DUF4340 domain-containing protein [Acidobacteria bacterium]|nr:DUF4340 domain-containing protein [Acidobacteriota bacterium]
MLLIAVIGIALVYHFEYKDAEPRDAEPDKSKPAFAFKREELTGLTITKSGQLLVLEASEGKWSLVKPVSAPANVSEVDSLVGDLVNAKVERAIQATADQLKNFGLAEPVVTVELTLKDGKSHRLRLGEKDFSGLSVYGILDDSPEVSMFPASLLTSADKSLNDLRDMSIFGGLTQYDIGSLQVKNANGVFTLDKQNADWVLKLPSETAADQREVNSLLSEISSAKAKEVVSESGDDLARYGLQQPGITVTARLQTGDERQVLVAIKTDGGEKNYYAKSSDRPHIFRIDESLYDKLNAKSSTLRSKEFIKINEDDLSRIVIRNSNSTVTVEKDSEGKWILKQPAEQKDKEALSYKLIDPFESYKATEVIDKSTPAISAKLARPAIEVRLTATDGYTTVLKLSSAEGDDCYLRVEGRQEVYKVSKALFDALNFKPADLVE